MTKPKEDKLRPEEKKRREKNDRKHWLKEFDKIKEECSQKPQDL